jgi:hypothetical protein
MTPNRRELLAFIIAPLIPVILNALALWQVFTIALIVGVVCAYLLTAVFAAPFYLSLKRRGALRAKWVVIFAGVIAAIPDLMISLSGLVLGGMNMLKENDVWLIYEGHYTWAGITYYFVIRPLVYWVIGAAGGLAFWQIAFGRTPSSPTPSNNTASVARKKRSAFRDDPR